MKKILYKNIILTCLFISSVSYAQKIDKKYTEKFKTEPTVLIDVDTRHTDIIVETWNRNEVEIEATISIEGASEEQKKEILENWKFKALGNKTEVKISSKNHGIFIENLSFSNGEELHFGPQSLNFHYPEISVENLGILDSFDMVLPDVMEFPEMPVIPEMHNLHFEMEMPEFDYEKYQKDKNYMKEWQDKMKLQLEKMQVELKENSALFKERSAQHREELKARQEERRKQVEELRGKRAEMLEEHAKHRKEQAKIRKEVLIKRQEEMAKNRKIVRDILANRDKIKIKRIITIKAPKDAKFNMNVKYGTMSFPN